jgi:hypothetical protein
VPRTVSLLLVLTAAAVSPAAEPPKFVWTAGDTMTYKVSQNTTVDELVLDEGAKKPTAVKTVTALTSTKQWAVKAVGKDGSATLEMTVAALRQEVTQTVGDKKPVNRVIDSADPEDAKGMPFLNKPVFTLTVDTSGKVLEAKSDQKAAAERLEAELPFRLVWPAKMPAVNDTWERAFVLKLPPPLGTGEKFDATQTYTFRGMKDAYAVVGVSTTVKDLPSDPAVVPALAPVLWEGDVFFNTKTGRYHGAKLAVKKEVANHRGDGTKFTYTSEYTEAAAEK